MIKMPDLYSYVVRKSRLSDCVPTRFDYMISGLSCYVDGKFLHISVGYRAYRPLNTEKVQVGRTVVHIGEPGLVCDIQLPLGNWVQAREEVLNWLAKEGAAANFDDIIINRHLVFAAIFNAGTLYTCPQ